MGIDQAIIDDYTQDGLYDRLVASIAPAPVSTKSLRAVDSMHLGGWVATDYLLDAMMLGPDMHVLDVGSGLGGAARHAAEKSGVFVTGIDLTPLFCDIADRLSAEVGLSGRVNFHAGTALAMPFADAAFDAAYTIHAGMNIQDKDSLYKEVFRTLKPGARFGIYDICRGEGEGNPAFPLPWSARAETSFLVRMDALLAHLSQAGFVVESTEDRTPFACAAIEKVRARATPHGGGTGAGDGSHDPVRGDGFARRIENLAAALEDSRCAVWQVVCRKPGGGGLETP